ncbi:hypothetical protein [Leptospira kmetyi]|uniref:hypothetical protein n=1 Tax=Leptospira kmetyi TaxID=408139 RepID=UPI00039058A7|nr:hypothetical protein [Leptospira kmetyi]EQA55398.1 hypothetical protein LEP1GSC052_0021 [Leptospira kmetyi serovar Malaysia str. Bejo-Iso9]
MFSSVVGGVTSGFNSLTGGAFSGSLAPTYEPQNVFSFAFYEKKTNGSYSIFQNQNEYFFVNGPLNYNENFKNRTLVEKTFGSVVVVDYGLDNSELKLEGEFHIYHLGLPAKPKMSIPGDSGAGFVQSAFSAGKSILKNKVGSYYDKIRSSYLSLGGGEFRSGLQEFNDFMFFLHYSRSLDAVEYSSNDSQAQKITKLFSEKRLTWKTHAFVFRDYDRNRTVEVIIPQNGFTVTRSVSDTNTYKYSLNLVVVKELNSKITSQLVRSNFNAFRTISGLMNELENLVNLPLKLSGALLGVARGIQVFASSTKRLLSSWDRMKDQFNAQGKLARVTFESAKSDLGISKKKRGFHAEEISDLIDEAYKKSRANEAEFRQNIDQSINDCSALFALIGQFVIPVDNSGSYEAMSLKPGADFTAWVDNDVYRFAITADEILLETLAALNEAGIDNEYTILHTTSSDTWEKIADERLGDAGLGQALASYNGKRDSKLDRLAIRIPYGTKTNIFTSLPENPTPKELEIALVGCDIKLTPNRGIEVSPTGDLALVEGDDALLNEKLDHIDIEQGSIPGAPEIGNPIPPGELPDEIQRKNYIPQILRQIKSDPRITDAKFFGSAQDGDTLHLQFYIESVSGGSAIISV